MSVKSRITIFATGLLAGLAMLAATPTAASAAAAPDLTATLSAQSRAATGPLCSPTRPTTPAPGVGTARFSFDRAFLLALAKTGVITYATAPGQTSACLNPISAGLTFPLEPTVRGAGTLSAKLDGQLAFRRVRTGATVALGLRTFSHPAVGNYVFIDADLPIQERILFSVGLPDATGARPIYFSRPEVISQPLGVAFTFQGQVGTLTTAYPTP